MKSRFFDPPGPQGWCFRIFFSRFRDQGPISYRFYRTQKKSLTLDPPARWSLQRPCLNCLSKLDLRPSKLVHYENGENLSAWMIKFIRFFRPDIAVYFCDKDVNLTLFVEYTINEKDTSQNHRLRQNQRTVSHRMFISNWLRFHANLLMSLESSCPIVLSFTIKRLIFVYTCVSSIGVNYNPIALPRMMLELESYRLFVY
jgi:hypothetical protein